jgi:hypothetical protein
MRQRKGLNIGSGVCGLVVLFGAIGSACAADGKPAYPAMAPIALSRSAAPGSIADDASVLTLGDHGYETASKGKNGFVCLVQRSWAAGFDDVDFWNPKLRAPICFNAAAARTILPAYLERTKWALAGVSKADMMKRTSAELAAKPIATPDPSAVAYMMSKQGYLGDAAGHWHPHLMFFSGYTDVADWGANLHGSPVFSARDDSQRLTTFYVLVPAWSDGTPAAMDIH